MKNEEKLPEGLTTGLWQEIPEHETSNPMSNIQLEALMKLRNIVETLLKEDQQKIAGLKEQLTRLQFGGGS
jgi:hypothetical protein